MRVCLLSYQINHRKTFDVLTGLKAKGYKDVCVYLIPLQYKKKFTPLFEHRPSCSCTLYENLDYKKVIQNFGYEYKLINSYLDIKENDSVVWLVCGAGLLPASFYKNNIVINSHPGFIPFVRGLDSLKWAIVEEKTIGVTSHFIGDYVDAGDIICREEVPVYQNDTFHAVSERVYHSEIRLLVNAVENHEVLFSTNGEDYVVHKRMPHEIESHLLEKFENWKKDFLNRDERVKV
ncbi:MAG: phosphoribosylglycinamide formyltransferase [Pseudobutyrivibrio ruminis]|nr:phosphoribosylglycinamide formyltransferase [Pseudobutyrivibrio ruminis]